ncbi:HD domain-containing protein [Roseimarinus sediminis]|uniref:HD domain-containing protein n=1 Tax=Roseimarinus sediminis TaxID=1610899 RepID=UPI003D195A75
MSDFSTNKRKILNDPVFGFINLQSDVVFDLIEHPYFQRLRRIKQLGLSYLVYPGANHTRFEHALGALHLMRSAIDTLRIKNIEISPEEAEAVMIAILLHDIGHGPFSHALEYTLVTGVTHEQLSLMLMEQLNMEMNHQLDMAIAIFRNQYHKKFLHQLVASQLDMDRLDYLRRDSFFSGVVEGTIGSDRIIKMLNVRNDQLVVEKKGIYSVEKFLLARRLMYWQVYLHKTVIVAEQLLINVLKRAKQQALSGNEIFATPALSWFLHHQSAPGALSNPELKAELLNHFIDLDDTDIMASIKVWRRHPDPVLSYLSKAIVNRKLFKIALASKPFPARRIDELRSKAVQHFKLDMDDAHFYVFSDHITNKLYELDVDDIMVLLKNGKTVTLEKASDIALGALSKSVKKYFLCYPKELDYN